MRLLILTQAVDLDDSVLGFFHGWIAELSKHSEQISVVCLKKGRYSLPANVSVYSLGKEKGNSRITYVLNFYRYIWKLRNEYDAVFVHMNQEYVLLGWKLWWLFGKRVVLWRNHKKGSIWTRLAAMLAYRICYTSPEAYVAGYKNAVQMPVGIDTEQFKPAGTPSPNSILFLGRLDAVKRAEIFVAALEQLRANDVAFHADIVGNPTPGSEQYAHGVRNKASTLALDGVLTMHPGVPHAQTPALYASHAIYVNLTPSGSFDKTIGEAMASGCTVVASNGAVREVIGDDSMADDIETTTRALTMALSLSGDARMHAADRNRAYVIDHHSLALLSDTLIALFQ